MAEVIKCELCRREIKKEQKNWSGPFVLCEKCLAYLKGKETDK